MDKDELVKNVRKVGEYIRGELINVKGVMKGIKDIKGVGTNLWIDTEGEEGA